MEHPRVRINKLTVNNVKCVTHGSIDFGVFDALHQEKSGVLGIYGQNGSGKTVVIEALTMLRDIFSGQPLSHRFIECISYGTNSCQLRVELLIADDNTNCIAEYECKLEQREDPNVSTDKRTAVGKNSQSAVLSVVSECLKVSGLINGEKYPNQTIAQVDELTDLIRPENKCKRLFGNNPETIKKLKHDKVLALYGSRSFLFSKQATDIIQNSEEYNFSSVIDAIRFFAFAKLHIVGGEAQNYTPFEFNFFVESDGEGIKGQLPFSLENNVRVSKKIVELFEVFVPQLNVVLLSIIPGLSIQHKSQKISVDEDDDMYELELFSSRPTNLVFPLRQESLGIKKIVSFLSLLIATYNDPGCVLVVDEFDSSIFEFLLGELISIFNDSGKGQLIFTSHNLRPLEKLDAPSICFTTTDPSNRYVKIKKKTTNNLRDMYFRIISLGGADFDLYDSASKSAISFAFREAGRSE